MSEKRTSINYENKMNQLGIGRSGSRQNPAAPNHVPSGSPRKQQRHDYYYDQRLADQRYSERALRGIDGNATSEFNENYKKNIHDERHVSQKETEHGSHSNESSKDIRSRYRQITNNEHNKRRSSSAVRDRDRVDYQETNERRKNNLQIELKGSNSKCCNRGSQRSHRERRVDNEDKKIDTRHIKEDNYSQERTRQIYARSEYEVRDDQRSCQGELEIGERYKYCNGGNSVQIRSSCTDSDHHSKKRRSSSVRHNEMRYNPHSCATHTVTQKTQARIDNLRSESDHGVSHSKMCLSSQLDNTKNKSESYRTVLETSDQHHVGTTKPQRKNERRHSLALSDSQSSTMLAHTVPTERTIGHSSPCVINNPKDMTNSLSNEIHRRRHSTSPRNESQTSETVHRRRKSGSHYVDNDHRHDHLRIDTCSRGRSASSTNEHDGFNTSFYNHDFSKSKHSSSCNTIHGPDAASFLSSNRPDSFQSRNSSDASPTNYANSHGHRSRGKDYERHPRSTVMVNSHFSAKEQFVTSCRKNSSGAIGISDFNESANDSNSAVKENKRNVNEQNMEPAQCRTSGNITTCQELVNGKNNTVSSVTPLSVTVKENALATSASLSSFSAAKDKGSSNMLSKSSITQSTTSASAVKGISIGSKNFISDSISSLFGRGNKDKQLQSNHSSETPETVPISERFRRLKQGIIPDKDLSIADFLTGKDTAAGLFQAAAAKIANTLNSLPGVHISLSKDATLSSKSSANNENSSFSYSNIPQNENVASLTKADAEGSGSPNGKSELSTQPQIETHSSEQSKPDQLPSQYSNPSSLNVPPDTISQRPSTISTNGNLSTHCKRTNAYSKMTEIIDSPDSEESGQMTPPPRIEEMKRKSKETDNELTSFLPAEMSRREEKFHEAARVNCAAVIRHLIKERVNVDCRNSFDRTALHWAAANGNLEATEALIENGADVEAKDKYGMRAVLWAAWFGHISVLKALVNAGANTRVTNKQGLSVLHCASENNHLAVIAFVFDALEPHHINQRDKKERTPLHLAAEGGHVEAVNRLLEAKADLHKKDKEGMTAVHLAAKHGHIDVLKALLLQGVEVDDRDVDGRTALHLAAESGHKEAVDLLLDYTANPNSETVKEVTPLHVAAQEGHIEVCRSLVKYGSNLNAQNFQGNSALHIAANGNHKELARILIDVKCELDLPNNIFLNWYADCSLTLKQKYSDFRENIDPIDFSQRMQTPLHVAIERGHLEIVQVLLAGGASLDTREKSGKSALQLAARGNYITVVDMIIKAERYYANAREYHDKDVGYVDPNTYLRNPQHPKAHQMKDLLWKLSMKQLKPADWKKLAYHWRFTPEHVKAIEQEYTGNTSYKEHGYRLLDIWLHGVRKDENVLKLLTEALVAIDRKQLADQG